VIQAPITNYSAGRTFEIVSGAPLLLGEVGRPSGGATGWGRRGCVTGKLGLDLAGDLRRVFVEDQMAGVDVERDQSLKLVPALASELPKLVARRRFESLSDGLSRDSI
jgi:hypothetical protein